MMRSSYEKNQHRYYHHQQTFKAQKITRGSPNFFPSFFILSLLQAQVTRHTRKFHALIASTCVWLPTLMD